MNVSLPDELKMSVDRMTSSGGYSSASEYVRELIRRDLDIRSFRDMLLEAAEAPVAVTADAEYFASLRDRALRRSDQAAAPEAQTSPDETSTDA